MIDSIKSFFLKLVNLFPCAITPEVKPAEVTAVSADAVVEKPKKKKPAPIVRAAQKKAASDELAAPKRRGRPKKSSA